MSKNKILLVDDEVNLRDTIAELLMYENYTVKLASNGQDALDILDHWIPDLIISDIMMPIMDGNDFHDIIKENANLSSIPFIFITAMNEENQMRKYLTKGADDFLAKPFKIKDLIEIVKNKIDRFNKIKNAHSNIYIGEKKHFSHEINTPLHGILGAVNLLMENDDFNKEDLLLFYESIKISGERLNKTMQNVMLFQSIKNNSLQFNTNDSSSILNSFFAAQTKLLEIYPDHEDRIHFEIDKADLKINKSHLELVLFELIDNALKFSPIDSKINITGAPFNDALYSLTIADQGIGFSEEQLEQIGPAQQFDREKYEQQGLGLGLYLSKFIIKNYDGLFNINSTVNVGTSINILLPLTASKP